MSATRVSTHRAPASAGVRSGEAGTTLVEALVVVALTAMIGAIAFPQLRKAVAEAAFDQAVAGLRADMRLARAQSVRSGEPVALVVAPDGRSYGWTPGPRRGLVGDLALSPSGAAVRFYPDGSADGGEMKLRDGRSLTRFDIDGGTGVLRSAL